MPNKILMYFTGSGKKKKEYKNIYLAQSEWLLLVATHVGEGL